MSWPPPPLRRGGEELQQWRGAERREEGPPAAVPALRTRLVLLRRPLRGPPLVLLRRQRPLLPLRHQEDAGQGQVGGQQDGRASVKDMSTDIRVQFVKKRPW